MKKQMHSRLKQSLYILYNEEQYGRGPQLGHSVRGPGLQGLERFHFLTHIANH
jgi:hypothetical protein